MNVYILNGPPGSGKDTIAAAVLSACPREPWAIAQFKESLYRSSYDWLIDSVEVFKVINFSFEEFVAVCTDTFKKELKKFPVGRPFRVEGNEKDTGHKNWSARMILQHVSENIMKPLHGDGVFGDISVNHLKRLEEEGFTNVFFSDGGFLGEINVIAEAFPTSVIHLYREGSSFEGDSRDYVFSDKAEATYALRNDGLLSSAVDDIINLIRK